MMNLHEQEERDFGRGPLLWDADPEVCCAAFQLGACPHTEAFDEFDEAYEGLDEDGEFWGGVVVSDAQIEALIGSGEEEPF